VAEAQRIYADHAAPGDFVVGVQMRTQKRTRLHPPVRCCRCGASAIRVQLDQGQDQGFVQGQDQV